LSTDLSGADITHKQNPSEPTKDGNHQYGETSGWVSSVGHIVTRGIDKVSSAFEKIIHPTGRLQIHRNDTKKPVTYEMNPGHHLEYFGGGKSSNQDGNKDQATKGNLRTNTTKDASDATGENRYQGTGKSNIGGSGGDGGSEIYENTKYLLAKKDVINFVNGDLHNSVDGDIVSTSGNNMILKSGQDINMTAQQNYDLRTEQNIQLKSASANINIISTSSSNVVVSPSIITINNPSAITIAVGNSLISMDDYSITLQVGGQGIKISSVGVSITGKTYVGVEGIGSTQTTATAPATQFPG
jgi:hypothetical protein